MRARAVLFSLVLAGCSAKPSTLPPLKSASLAVESFAGEQTLLNRYPNLARREGNILKVASRGGWMLYESTDCEASADNCASYTPDQAFLDGRLLGIDVGYYEGGDYIVADSESLHEYTGDKPIFSPNNQLFATAVYNEAYETNSEGVGLWRLDFPLRKIRTISPRVLSYPDKLRWRGNDCVEFTAIEGEYDEAARRTYYLVKAEPEWRLERKPAGECVAAVPPK